MAGGGFLSSMFTTMIAKLHSLASPSTASSSSSPRRNIEQEMSKLTETMRRIQAKLDDSEEENHAKSHSEKLWLSELKDVARDAEDVVEEYEYEVLRSKQLHESNRGPHDQVERERKLYLSKLNEFDNLLKKSYGSQSPSFHQMNSAPISSTPQMSQSPVFMNNASSVNLQGNNGSLFQILVD